MIERRFLEDLTEALGPVHVECVLDLPNPAQANIPVKLFDLIGALAQLFQSLLRPAPSAAKVGIGATRNLTCSQSELLAENALLRQQVIVLRRSIRRPRIHHDDRLLLLILLILVRLVRLWHRWRDALHLVKPETLLCWHRDLCTFAGTRKSRTCGQPRRLAPEIIMLIQALAKGDVLSQIEPICERFLGSVRRKCLNQVMILREQQLRLVLKEYVEIYLNRSRPHQGLG